MTYHPDDIARVDTWKYLEENEESFFRSGSFDAVELAGMIAMEALLRGATQAHILAEGDWLTVTADRDWLAPHEEEAFDAVIPFPEAGANSMLAEVLTVAYSSGVATASHRNMRILKGGTAPAACTVDNGTARAVSFRRSRSTRACVEL